MPPSALGEAVKGPNATSMGKGKASACEYEGSGLHRVQLNVDAVRCRDGRHVQGDVLEEDQGRSDWARRRGVLVQRQARRVAVLKGLTMFSIELRKSGDPTEAIKGVARKVYDRGEITLVES
jgi:hypothetical protein